MGRFDTIKTTIDANIKTNGNQEITGQKLNSVLNEMVYATDAELTELESEVRNISAEILVEGNVPNNSTYKYFPLEMRKGDKLTLSITNLSSDVGGQVRFLKTNDPASFWGGQLVMENVAVNKEIVVDDDYSFVGCWTSPSVSFDIEVSKVGNYNLASLSKKTDNISSELNDLSSELSDIVTTRLVELLSKDSKLSEGYLDLESGNFVAAPISGGGDAYTTDFLRVKENELLIIHIAHSYENNVLAMYDEQKGFISAIRTNNALSLEAIIPSNVAYIRYAFLANTLSELSITMTDKGIPANSLNFQLGGMYEKTDGIVEIYNYARLEKRGIYEGAYLEQNGGIAAVNDASVSHLIPLCGSGDILFNPKATRGFQSSRFTFFDKDLNILSSDFSNSLRLACPDKAKYARFDMSIAFQEKEYIRQVAEIEIPSLLNSALNEMSLEKKVTRYLVNGDVASTGKADIYTLFKNIKKGHTYRITIMSKYATPSISISTTNRIDSQLLNYMVEEDFITFSEEDIANAKTKIWTAKADALYASAWIPSLTEIVVIVEECESEIRKTSRMAELSLEAQRAARYRSIMAGFPNSGKMFRVFGTYDLRYWEAFGNEFVPSKGSGFTRDPSLGIVGDYYYIVYTDASDWTMPCHTIGMARTKDFYTYEELDILECGTQFKKVWAPAFYMENGKVYIIYAATTTGGGDFQVYISEYNVANHSLSEPTRLDIGGLASVIDYHIHKIDGEYYAVGKDDLLFKTVIAKSSTLMGDYEIVLHENLSGVPEEGQFAMQLSENRWRIFLNDYSVNQQILYIDVDSITSPQKFSSVGKISYEGEGIDAPLFHPSFIDNNFNEIDYPRMS